MNFFEHQDAARKLTRRFVWFFILAVAVIVVTLVIVITMLLEEGSGRFDGGTMTLVALSVLAVIGGASLLRLKRLSQGGHVVAEMMGARKVELSTDDAKERMLLNVVEEMSIASGTARPEVYIMDNEQGINAFAAGYTADNAIVAVTAGALNAFTRDELQGVIAHEFSHILNGDMRLNVRLLGVLAGILLIGNIGYFMLRGSTYARTSRDNRGAAAIFMLGLVFVILGFLGLFLGRMIQSSVSRQREYLADASAVQFTRSPEGIAGALNKIRLVSDGSFINSMHSGEVNHMCFGESVRIRMMSNMMASHPPLDQRIQRVSPDFDLTAIISMPESYIEAQRSAVDEDNVEVSPSDQHPIGSRERIAAAAGLASSSMVDASWKAAEPVSSATTIHTTTQEVINEVGTVSQEQITQAQEMHSAIPMVIHDALTTDQGARAVTYCLVMDMEDRTRERQVNLIVKEDCAPVAKLAMNLWREVVDLGVPYRLPILDLAMGLVSRQDKETRNIVATTMRELVMFDGKVDFAELIVMLAVSPYLSDKALRAVPNRNRKIAKLKPELSVVFGLLAMAGSESDSERQEVYAIAVKHCDMAGYDFPEDSQISFSVINKALHKLRSLRPVRKQQVFESCVEMALYDDEVTLREYELLRLLSKSLDCPLPIKITELA